MGNLWWPFIAMVIAGAGQHFIDRLWKRLARRVEAPANHPAHRTRREKP